MKVDVIKNAYKLFKTLTKSGFDVYQVDPQNNSKIQKGDVREILGNYPIYIALVEKVEAVNNIMFKAIVLTEDIILGYLNQKTPIIDLPKQKTLLVVLPVWIYLDEKFLLNYTNKIGVINDESIKRLKDYAERTKIPEDIRGEYIRDVMKLLAKYNTESIVNTIDKLENNNTTVIRIPDELKKYFEEKFAPKN